ncbi:hypothetical protein GDO78_007497 [Eleutherodactylus coqui]|uniref:Purinergic receptor n=1 Tax=Eleutherodactylus coqui TaxID=57060 RepID=A0A8J6FGT5_ELECQ|nr:hypothetical protein GDO78_007497 [Eleutherodactylus coqui]
MSGGGGCCGELYSCVFDYSTPRIALIKSRKVGLLNRVIQLVILAYVIGWVFVWEKGYQEFDTVISSVTSKVKGVAATNTSELGFRVWDVADYIIPPQEENAFFVMTNLILTPNQTQRQCPEVRVQTGRCVAYNETVKTCEVDAWCPVENDLTVPKPAFLGSAENFTVLIKNNIWYPKFNFSKFAKFFKDSSNVESRTLMKIYGIRFDVLVFGTAGKFDIIPTMINIGSGVALLGVATVLCDIIIFHFFKKRYYYREKKFKHVEDYEELGDNGTIP